MSYYTQAQRNGQQWAQPKPQYVTPKASYTVQMYRDNETGRERWAVLASNGVWYFAARYGIKAAKAYCLKLNKGTI